MERERGAGSTRLQPFGESSRSAALKKVVSLLGFPLLDFHVHGLLVVLQNAPPPVEKKF